MRRAGRNDACPCGSGKKYKKCCAAKQASSRMSKIKIAALVAVLAGAIYAVAVGFGERGSAVAAPGRVWSPEHGHYH
jgi:hypothetical protein